MPTVNGRVLDIVKSKPDERDHIFKSTRPVVTPDSVSLEWGLPGKVRDQGNEGSCGAHAFTELFEMQRHLFWKDLKNPTFTKETYFSVADCYWNIRTRMGDNQHDTGIDIRSGAESLTKDGVCREQLDEYKDGAFKQAPSKAAQDEAKQHHIGAYHRILNSVNAVECIASGYPFVAGLELYSAFMSDAVGSSGLVPMPSRADQFEGGHAVLAHSYDKNKDILGMKGGVKFLNSWGPEWGLKGHFWIPFAYLDMYAMDMFTGHLGKPW